MKSRAAMWTFSGLFFAAVMVAFLGLTSASATDQTAQKKHANSLSNGVSSSQITLSKKVMDQENGKHQTTRVFWPIWNGRR